MITNIIICVLFKKEFNFFLPGRHVAFAELCVQQGSQHISCGTRHWTCSWMRTGLALQCNATSIHRNNVTYRHTSRVVLQQVLAIVINSLCLCKGMSVELHYGTRMCGVGFALGSCQKQQLYSFSNKFDGHAAPSLACPHQQAADVNRASVLL